MRQIDPISPRQYQALVLILCLFLTGCGWQKKISFQAPDGQQQVLILQPWPENSWGFRIDLANRGERHTVYSHKGESFINFIHVYWSDDSGLFAVLATGSTCIKFAYDIQQHREIAFERMKEAMAASIRAEYHLDRDKRGDRIDPIDWAWSYPAHLVFSRLHPEAISK